MVLPLPPTHMWSLYLVQRSELSLTPEPMSSCLGDPQASSIQAYTTLSPKAFPDGKLRHHRTGEIEQERLVASFRPQQGWVCKG